MKENVHISSDYAGLNTEKYSFYFGYEEVDDNDEWCFVASNQKTGDTIVKWSCSEIDAGGDYPEVALLKGIGRFITTFEL